MAAQMLLGRLACAGEACDSQRRRTAGVSAVVFTGTPQRKGARRAAPPRRLPRACRAAVLLDDGARSQAPARWLAEEGVVYEELFRLRSYEVGFDQQATMVTIANLLQEAAANHAQVMWGERTWTPQIMAEQNQAFAMAKLNIRMSQPVAWGSTVRVTTWFGEEGKVAARRDWVVSDAATGERLGAGTSTWLPFSLETRRMARLPPALRTWFHTNSPQPPRWALGEAFAPERCAELAADAPCCVSALLRVRRCDLDMNRHVNNASYLRWILEDVPSHVCEGAFACGVDIEYRAECGYGDEVVSRSELRRADGQCLAGADGDVGVGGFTLQHALLRTRDKAELLRARTHWRPLPPPA